MTVLQPSPPPHILEWVDALAESCECCPDVWLDFPYADLPWIAEVEHRCGKKIERVAHD